MNESSVTSLCETGFRVCLKTADKRDHCFSIKPDKDFLNPSLRDSVTDINGRVTDLLTECRELYSSGRTANGIAIRFSSSDTTGGTSNPSYEESLYNLLHFKHDNLLFYLAFGHLEVPVQYHPIQFEKRQCVLLDYVEGPSLEDFSNANEPNEEQILKFAEQLLNGLEYLHNEKCTTLGHLTGKTVMVVEQEKIKIGCLEDAVIWNSKKCHHGRNIAPCFECRDSLDDGIDIRNLGSIVADIISQKFVDMSENIDRLAKMCVSNQKFTAEGLLKMVRMWLDDLKKVRQSVPKKCYLIFKDQNNSRHPFEVLSVLGDGGHGFVYEVTDRFAKKQAIKIFYKPPPELDNVKLMSLKHPHLVKFQAVGAVTEANFPLICLPVPSLLMEYCEGGTLKGLSESRTLFEPEIICFTRQVLQGLSYLHQLELPIMHGDIKGENIFLTADKVIKIGDCDNSVRFKGEKTLVTDLNAPVGTLSYMSPEMRLKILQPDTVVGRKTDIWSVGRTVLEMFDGDRLCNINVQEGSFQLNKVDINQFVRLVTSHDVTFIRKTGEKMSDTVHRIVQECLRREPTSRPEAHMLLRALM